MTAPTDPTLPKDPADYRPRPLMGVGFWMLIALCVLCILAGAGLALLGPRFLPTQPPAAPPVAPAAPVAQPAALPAPAPSAFGPADPAEIDRLNARIAALESRGARTSEAAAAALAAAALVEASQGSRPFAGELTALRAAAPGLPELSGLAKVAETGAPSRAALAESFPDYAARAASAARSPKDGAKLGDRIVYVLSRIVSVRRVGEVSGTGADAALARAERALADGDVIRALRALDALPPEAREAMGPWRALAERRAEIDRHAAQLRARAVRELAEGGDEA